MDSWPAKNEKTDLQRTRDSAPTDHTIFLSPSRHRDCYHTEHECPHVSAGFYVLEPNDTRHKEFREEYPKCLWCKYDSNDTLDLE